MLVKIKVGDKELQFDSKDHLIAILLDDGARQSIDNMAPNERLILSGPLQHMQNPAEAMQWGMSGWKGAKFIPGTLLGQDGRAL